MRVSWTYAAAGALVLALVSRAAFAPQAAGADADEAAIKKRAPEFVAAWNKHDAKALAAFWTEDGDFVGPWGRRAAGRAEVEKLFADEHSGKGPYRESTLEVKSDSVRLVTADVAVEDLEVLVTGAFAPDGSKAPTTTLLVPMVVKRVGTSWKTFAARPHMKLQPAIAAAAGGLPAPAAPPAAGPKAEALTPETIKEVMDGLRAAKVTEKAPTQPLIEIIKRVAQKAGVQVLFSPAAERVATEEQVELAFENAEATVILDTLAGVGNLKWSVAAKGVIRFDKK